MYSGVDRARLYLGRDPATGSRKWLSKTVHGTKKDAEAVLHGLLRERDLGRLTVPSGITLSELTQRSLEKASRRARTKTLDWYAATLQR